MKKTRITVLLLLALGLCTPLAAQENESVILRAMQDELTRNMEKLTIEKMSPPFFISYTVADERRARIVGVAGGITDFDTTHARTHDVRVLVGDYQQTQELYQSMNFGASMYGRGSGMALDDDYDAIRRDLWLSTDRAYKNAVETLEKKRAAVKQQQISDEMKSLPDFARAEPLQLRQDHVPITCDIAGWKDHVAMLSRIFLEFPDISVSNVTFSLTDETRYFISSEGSRISTPRQLVAVMATASAQAEDGEVLSDFVLHLAVAPEDLPGIETIAGDIRAMAGTLTERRTATRMNGTYTGPVLFEDQAAAELFVRLFLGDEGLLASRMPVLDGPLAALGSQLQKRNLGEKMGRRVLPQEVSISSTPKRAAFEATPLIGAYTVDAEGVPPADELTLIREGTVEALLANRTPTLYTSASTGHHCPGLGSFAISSGAIAPGVLDVFVSEGPTAEAMKTELLERARDEGLEYAYIVRRIRPETVPAPPVDTDLSATFSMFGRNPGEASAPLGDVVAIYRVATADGSEELMRNIEVLKPGSSPLRRCLASRDRAAWNSTMAGSSSIPGMGAIISIGSSMSGGLSGIPTSV
ncbi:MAG: metallopeptidase TldD-related protein, partial [Bacteroidota bacterium]|nr:metallopeptidase TldD-related protein [Bacteroidota bacterium]